MRMQTLIKTVITSLIFASAANAAMVAKEIPYYGEQFFRELGSGVSNLPLQNTIKNVLRGTHTQVPGSYDKISSSCSGEGRCYRHSSVGYNAARVFLLGNYYLVKRGEEYAVFDVYCNRERTSSDFNHKNPPGPGVIPDNNVINVEHTWPQSRFSGKFPSDLQKADLHHLFPTDSKINGIRGNHKFGEVTQDKMNLSCSESRYGYGSAGREDIFEPPQNHKGNVARALFYFSLRYDRPIDTNEEAILKKWNYEDPVDEDEIARNEAIFESQGNRNPFVDYPELADRITDF